MDEKKKEKESKKESDAAKSSHKKRKEKRPHDPENLAAIKIQSLVRGFQTRRHLTEKRERERQFRAAVRVQSWYRGWSGRRKAEIARLEKAEQDAAVRIQRIYRGYCTRSLLRDSPQPRPPPVKSKLKNNVNDYLNAAVMPILQTALEELAVAVRDYEAQVRAREDELAAREARRREREAKRKPSEVYVPIPEDTIPLPPIAPLNPIHHLATILRRYVQPKRPQPPRALEQAQISLVTRSQLNLHMRRITPNDNESAAASVTAGSEASSRQSSTRTMDGLSLVAAK